MELDTREIFYISKYLEGFLYGMISDSVLQLSLPTLKLSLPGIYSGVFALYLRHYAARKLKGTSNAILFYALCVLYILSTVIMTLDMAYFVALGNVSNNEQKKTFVLIISCAEPEHQFSITVPS